MRMSGKSMGSAAALLAAFSITLNNNGTAADNVTLYDQSSLVNKTWNISSSSIDAGGAHSVQLAGPGPYATITVNGGAGPTGNTYNVKPAHNVNFFVSDAGGNGTLNYNATAAGVTGATNFGYVVGTSTATDFLVFYSGVTTVNIV